jgi:predicted alpha/beta-fold hydrolase
VCNEVSLSCGQGKLHDFIDVPKLTKNSNIVVLEPSHGNHFGFYEGRLLHAFTNVSSYTYPAKVAAEFFEVASSTRNFVHTAPPQ